MIDRLSTRPPLPRNWRRGDIERRGLPYYRLDEIDGIKAELRDGAGFVIVRDSLECPTDAEDITVRFGKALGRLLPQNAKRETLVEIADFTDEDEFDDRGYRSPGELTPHTDPPPLIVLMCVRKARNGGTNRLVSAEAIRETLQADAPHALARLEAGYPFFVPDETIPGAGSIWSEVPVFAEGAGGLSCIYYRPFIERAADIGEAPLSARSVEALNLFDTTSSDVDLTVTHTLEPGELLVLNNYRVLHARDDYEDWPEKDKRRKLLRLWLDADWMPKPPISHAIRLDAIASKHRTP